MKGDSVYLGHILDAIEKIESYVSVGRDVFISTSHWQDAVIRQLEIIGEAARGCPEIYALSIKGFPGVLLLDYVMC